jgi:type II restriction enzyme
MCGFTETFISIGETDSKSEAEATLKYVKTKFVRTMLGVLKVTQNNAKPTWKYVPLQDFTSKSDIDWTKSVYEIDLQLYKKYSLSKEEKDFIETHVKEMV